jgi:hypothetical protein
MIRNVLNYGAVLLSLAIVFAAHAQTGWPATDKRFRDKSEIGLVIGATLTPSVPLQSGGELHLNQSLALGAEYDYRFAGRHTAIYGGVDFLASPLDVKSSAPPVDVTPQYAYLFLTPHVLVKWNADGACQPWLEFGGGYANFAPGQPNPSLEKVTGAGSTGALFFGGGIDTKPLIHVPVPLLGSLPIGTRLEVRDFLSGQPNYGVPVTSSLQNNVAFTGGLLLRF